MRIVLFHPVRLPPKDYGGAERVVLWLAQGLIRLGHEVWVGALVGSQLPPGAHLIPFDEQARGVDALCRALPKGVDVVHFMAPPEEEALGALPCPWVLTVHGNGTPEEVFPRNSVFLTQDHARRHGAEAFVFNGLDPDEFLFEPERKSKDFVFLSKTSWKVKNVRGALDLCSRAGVSLQVAGGWRPFDSLLSSFVRPGVRWVGPVSGSRKAQLLASTQGLVFPVLWPEPFGLVIAEAMMSGTPVLANPRGSVPELIGPGTGRVLNSDAEWLDALRRGFGPDDFARARAWAIEKFHYLRMAEAYVDAYTRVRAGEFLNPAQPIAKGWQLG